MNVAYLDDRPGMMRVHIATERGRLACARYTRDVLRHWSKRHGMSTAAMTKSEIGWYMAQHGLIDADGTLRSGFPAGAS